MGYFSYYLHRVRGQYNFVQINWIAIEFIYLQAYLQTDKIIRQTDSLLGLVIWYRWLYTVFLYHCQWTYVLQFFFLGNWVFTMWDSRNRLLICLFCCILIFKTLNLTCIRIVKKIEILHFRIRFWTKYITKHPFKISMWR